MSYKTRLDALKDEAVTNYRELSDGSKPPMGKPEIEPKLLREMNDQIQGTQVIYLADGPRRMSGILDERSIFVIRELTESMIILKGNLRGFLKNYQNFSRIKTHQGLHGIYGQSAMTKFHKKRTEDFSDILFSLNSVLLELRLVEKQLQSISGMLSMQYSLANTMGSQFVGNATKRELRDLKALVNDFSVRISNIISEADDEIIPKLRVKSSSRMYPLNDSGRRPDRVFFEAAVAYMKVITKVFSLRDEAEKIGEETRKVAQSPVMSEQLDLAGSPPRELRGRKVAYFADSSYQIANNALRNIYDEAKAQFDAFPITKFGVSNAPDKTIRFTEEVKDNIRNALAAPSRDTKGRYISLGG